MNNKENLTKVVVFKDEHLSILPENPELFMQFWKDKFDLIPSVFKSSGYIESDVSCRWEYCAYFDVEIGYFRPTTDEEINAEIQKDKAIIERRRQKELKTLAELKSKYE